jgi:F0F1-type ATP synthase assembly protein I
MAALASVLSYALAGRGAAQAALLGGFIALAGGVVYAVRMLSAREGDVQSLVRAHYWGEAGKMGATLLMFAATFVLYPAVEALPLFIGYMAALAGYWLALFINK